MLSIWNGAVWYGLLELEFIEIDCFEKWGYVYREDIDLNEAASVKELFIGWNYNNANLIYKLIINNKMFELLKVADEVIL